MTKIMDHIISSFNDLIDIGQDGQKGYRLAAKKEKDRDLKLLFNRFADQKAQLVAELRNEFLKLDGNPERFGAPPVSSLRAQIFTKTIAAEDFSEDIITECEREEGNTLHAYRSVLEIENLPPDLHHVVERQYTQVKRAYDKISQLKRKNLIKEDDVDPLN